MPPFFLPTGQGYLLRLTVVPGAQRTQVVGLYGDRLKVRLAAPPEKGSANRELIDFLARSLNLPKSSFKLTVGAQSRSKVVWYRPVPGPVRPPLPSGACLQRIYLISR
jgi:uncharacterized protein (TIGR00251 family)